MVERLEKNPVLLNTLRVGKFAVDLFVIGLILYLTWVPSWYHLLLIFVGGVGDAAGRGTDRSRRGGERPGGGCATSAKTLVASIADRPAGRVAGRVAGDRRHAHSRSSSRCSAACPRRSASWKSASRRNWPNGRQAIPFRTPPPLPIAALAREPETA